MQQPKEFKLQLKDFLVKIIFVPLSTIVDCIAGGKNADNYALITIMSHALNVSVGVMS